MYVMIYEGCTSFGCNDDHARTARGSVESPIIVQRSGVDRAAGEREALERG